MKKWPIIVGIVVIIILAVLEFFYAKFKRPILFVSIILLFVLSLFTFERNEYYNNPILLCKKAVNYNSQNPVAWVNLGHSYKQKGNIK